MTENPSDRTLGQRDAAPQERAGTDDRVAPSATAAGPTEDRAGAADVAELEDRWMRAVADLDNLRKRYARELLREREAERELAASAFLPVVDAMDRAIEHADADPRSIVEGVRAVREQALAVLARLGYPRDEETGVPFDPTRHEVVGVVEAEGGGVAPGSVSAVLRPGYGIPGRQLRPAAVTVAKGSED